MVNLWWRKDLNFLALRLRNNSEKVEVLGQTGRKLPTQSLCRSTQRHLIYCSDEPGQVLAGQEKQLLDSSLQVEFHQEADGRIKWRGPQGATVRFRKTSDQDYGGTPGFQEARSNGRWRGMDHIRLLHGWRFVEAKCIDGDRLGPVAVAWLPPKEPPVINAELLYDGEHCLLLSSEHGDNLNCPVVMVKQSLSDALYPDDQSHLMCTSTELMPDRYSLSHMLFRDRLQLIPPRGFDIMLRIRCGKEVLINCPLPIAEKRAASSRQPFQKAETLYRPESLQSQQAMFSSPDNEYLSEEVWSDFCARMPSLARRIVREDLFDIFEDLPEEQTLLRLAPADLEDWIRVWEKKGTSIFGQGSVGKP